MEKKSSIARNLSITLWSVTAYMLSIVAQTTDEQLFRNSNAKLPCAGPNALDNQRVKKTLHSANWKGLRLPF